MAVPGDPAQPVQIVDVRDLARLVVQLLADDRPGACRAVGPAEPVTLAGLIGTCAEVAGSQVEIVPVPPETAPPFFPLIKADWASQQRGPGPRACLLPRWRRRPPACWPGTVGAASRRCRAVSPRRRKRRCSPGWLERPGTYQNAASRLY